MRRLLLASVLLVACSEDASQVPAADALTTPQGGGGATDIAEGGGATEAKAGGGSGNETQTFPFAGGASSTVGGSTAAGGSAAAGGTTSSPVTSSAGGVAPSGGTTAAGGTTAKGGSSATGGTTATATTLPSCPPSVVNMGPYPPALPMDYSYLGMCQGENTEYKKVDGYAVTSVEPRTDPNAILRVVPKCSRRTAILRDLSKKWCTSSVDNPLNDTVPGHAEIEASHQWYWLVTEHWDASWGVCPICGDAGAP